MVQQSVSAPSFHRNLPVPAALWTDYAIEGDSHRDVIAVVVSGSGVCGALPTHAPKWSLRLQVTDEVGPINPTDLFCGLTLATFPALRWRDLGITASIVDAEGEPRATATGTSTVLTIISWPVALFALSRDPQDDLVERNYRALARYVVAELVQHHERLRALAALDAINKAIEAEAEAARTPKTTIEPATPDPLAPVVPPVAPTDPLHGDTNQPPRED